MGRQYSLDYLESISGGDKDFIEDMLRTFITSVPEEINKIERCIEDADWRKVGEEAHKFGSNLLYLELEDLKQLTLKIESYGLDGKNLDEIPQLFLELKNGCNNIISILKKDFVFLNE
jgi:HPt (histidine-containing phosphotransfer) domain-containing protein